MESLISNYISIGLPFSYILVFLGMVFGGEEVLFIVAFLLYRDQLLFLPTLISVFSGAVLGDILWFLLGQRIMNYPIVLRISSRISFLKNEQMQKHDVFVIFLSKFIYGFNHIILAKLATSREPFFRFLSVDILATILWILTIGGLGFATSLTISQLRYVLHFFEIGLFLILLFYFVLNRFITPYFKKLLQSVTK